ncbi:MAG: DUF167 domain-containing protein [Deltaproteobacteria bacterium]|uniref:UPF0235 protein JW984_13905 n=1 Tax=Candidatus Zymogenus saltonus TaxID=2844893 RepID=A0A9D8KHM5_9DELT|nr:DUF167 domain-containing protein [Candidatus Zymogenus saltonus]
MINTVKKNNDIIFTVQVRAGCRREGITGEIDSALKVEVTAPPVEGKANNAVVKLIAKSLGLPKTAVKIESGEKSKIKRIRVTGATPEEIQRLIP